MGFLSPAIGCVVHYMPTSSERDRLGTGPLPAIITEVRDWGVSLLVLFGRLSGEGGCVVVGNATQTIRPEPGSWHWPPRAG